MPLIRYLEVFADQCHVQSTAADNSCKVPQIFSLSPSTLAHFLDAPLGVHRLPAGTE